jgi:ribosomal protein L12E/L44/L45/RPP1/RPP2
MLPRSWPGSRSASASPMSEGIWVPPGGSADPGREQGTEEQRRQPTEQEIAEQLREELKRMKVSDLLVQTLYTVSSLGYHKLAPESRDLEQARLAIESLRALLPVLKEAVPEEVSRDFGQVVANMQLAYAEAASTAVPEQVPEPEAQAPAAEERPAEEDLEPVDDEELGGGG